MIYKFEYWEKINMCSDCPAYSHNELEFCRIADECVKPYAKPDWCPLVEFMPTNTGEDTTAGAIRQSCDDADEKRVQACIRERNRMDGAVRTLENCNLIQRMVNQGTGEPEQRDGKCLGYAGNTDEPCETCKACPLQESYEKDGAENG